MSLVELDPRDVATEDPSLAAVLRRRVDGRWTVDPWGLDHDLVSVLGSTPLARLAVRVEGAGRVPDGPALVVHRSSVLGGEGSAVAVGLGVALGRAVRFPGVPDIALANALLRRLGGVRGHEADLRGLLRAGELVSVPWSDDDGVPGGALAAALVTGAPVLPVLVQPAAPFRRARLAVGGPVATRRRRRARSVDEVQEAVRVALVGPD